MPVNKHLLADLGCYELQFSGQLTYLEYRVMIMQMVALKGTYPSPHLSLVAYSGDVDLSVLDVELFDTHFPKLLGPQCSGIEARRSKCATLSPPANLPASIAQYIGRAQGYPVTQERVFETREAAVEWLAGVPTNA